MEKHIPQLKMNNSIDFICPICKRITPEEHQEYHHLIPRTLRHRNKYAKKLEEDNNTVLLCRNCADQIHKLFDEKELANNYDTLEKLLNNPDIQKWADWIHNRNDFSVCMKSKKRRL